MDAATFILELGVVAGIVVGIFCLAVFMGCEK